MSAHAVRKERKCRTSGSSARALRWYRLRKVTPSPGRSGSPSPWACSLDLRCFGRKGRPVPIAGEVAGLHRGRAQLRRPLRQVTLGVRQPCPGDWPYRLAPPLGPTNDSTFGSNGRAGAVAHKRRSWLAVTAGALELSIMAQRRSPATASAALRPCLL